MSLSKTAKRHALALLACASIAGATPLTGDEPVVFPIGGYSGRPAREAEAGFSIVGPVYGEAEATLAAAEELAMGMIYPVGVKIDFYNARGEMPESIDWEEVAREITSQVKSVAGRATIQAWYLSPEELRYWKPMELQYLQVAVDAIREADPKRRPIWMYEPGHRDRAALEKLLPHLDICGKGIYPNYAGRMHERSWVPWTLQQASQAIETANPEARLYAVLEMFQNPPEEKLPLIPAWVRHDCYASLVHGAQGIIIFSLFPRAGFSAWEAYYNAYAEVARELNGPLQLGPIALRGERKPPLPLRIVEGDEAITLPPNPSGPAESTLVPTLSQALFEWKGRQTLFLVNSSEETVSVAWEDAGSWKRLLERHPPVTKGGNTVTLPPLGTAIFQKEL